MFKDFIFFLRTRLAKSTSGNIVLQLATNHQEIGKVTIDNGAIVAVKFRSAFDQNALVNIIIELSFLNEGRIIYSFEPEISGDAKRMNLNFDSFIILNQEIIKKWDSLRKYIPSSKLKLKVVTTTSIDPNDEECYSVLDLVSRYKSVENLYNYTNLSYISLISVLIKLRGKKQIVAIS